MTLCMEVSITDGLVDLKEHTAAIMFTLYVVLLMTICVDNVRANIAKDVCGRDMLTAFLYQNKVTGYCLGTLRNLAEEKKPIAFYAYMTAPYTTKGIRDTLIFNKVRTNVYNAYNSTTGIYTVPKSGMYVFNWIVREADSEHSLELVRNQEVLGVTFKRALTRDDGSVTGNVVVEVNKGDSVFVRTHSRYDKKQQILNNEYGRSSYSGWRL